MSLTTNPIKVERLDSPDLDVNEVLQKQGIYRLSDVCQYMFFTSEQLRNQAKRCVDSRKVMGIFFYEPWGVYLVNMPVFAKWIADLWLRPKKLERHRSA